MEDPCGWAWVRVGCDLQPNRVQSPAVESVFVASPALNTSRKASPKGGPLQCEGDRIPYFETPVFSKLFLLEFPKA
jgi:hypothetical protein